MFFSFRNSISELRRPIAEKFCTVVCTRLNYKNWVQTFGGGGFPKKFNGPKHAKFGPISDDFKLRRRISPEWMKIFKIGQVFDLPRFHSR